MLGLNSFSDVLVCATSFVLALSIFVSADTQKTPRQKWLVIRKLLGCAVALSLLSCATNSSFQCSKPQSIPAPPKIVEAPAVLPIHEIVFPVHFAHPLIPPPFFRPPQQPPSCQRPFQQPASQSQATSSASCDPRTGTCSSRAFASAGQPSQSCPQGPREPAQAQPEQPTTKQQKLSADELKKDIRAISKSLEKLEKGFRQQPTDRLLAQIKQLRTEQARLLNLQGKLKAERKGR